MVSLVALAGLMLLNGCASTVTSILEPEKYTVSGVVADDQGNPIEGVTIIYTGDTSATCVTASNGTWTIIGLVGSIEIQPRKWG